jgi:two-component system response regulator DesR
MIRGALIALLEQEPDIRVVASVAQEDAIIPTAVRTDPHVAVIDICPNLHGLDAVAELPKHVPTCETIVLVATRQSGVLHRLFTSKARGLLFQDAPPEELAKAVRTVAAGDRFVDPQFAAALMDIEQNPLSERETQVLRLVAEGIETARVADILYMSKGTIQNYLTAIVAKLNARNRIDAIRIANDAGWLL